MTPIIDQLERIKIIAARINAGTDSYAGRLDVWHKLGIVSGEFQTWKDMIVAAKADFEVVKKQLDWNGKKIEAYGTFRRDLEVKKGLEDRAIKVADEQGYVSYLSFLGVVGKDYQVIQHTEGFDLMDRLVGEIEGAHYETMGTLDGGARVWGQVDPNVSIRVGDDVSDVLLSFLTSHDGSSAFDIYETGVRQVCRNTVRIGSLKRLASTLRVKHTKNSGKRIDSLKVEIDEIKKVALDMQDKLCFLARKKVNKDSMETVMKRLFPVAEDKEEGSTRRNNNISTILGIYEKNDGDVFPEQRGTAYNLLNAITNYTDHERSTKGDMRSQSALFGSGDKMKTTALQIILDEAKVMDDMRGIGIRRADTVMVDSVGLNIPGLVS